MIIKKGNLSLSLGRASLKFLVLSWTYWSQGFICGDNYLWTTSSVSYKVVLSRGPNYRGLICGIQKSFWKMLSMIKSNFEKFPASRIVSWEFSVISEDSSIRGQLYLKKAAQELFSCVLRTMRLFTFIYIATLKIFRIIIFVLFVSLETVLLALVSWKLWDFSIFLTK